jgi:hypothetical protein
VGDIQSTVILKGIILTPYRQKFKKKRRRNRGAVTSTTLIIAISEAQKICTALKAPRQCFLLPVRVGLAAGTAFGSDEASAIGSGLLRAGGRRKTLSIWAEFVLWKPAL